MLTDKKIIVLIPIKQESQRLLNKNFLPFNGKQLFEVILDKLEECNLISKIIINTDSVEIASKCKLKYSKVQIIKRPKTILGNHITMNTIIDYDLSQIEGEYFFQTHVTNPLLTIKTIEKAIDIYFSNLHQYDSLFSVNSIKKRAFNHKSEALNHHNSKLEETQNLNEILIENSNIFIFSRSSFYKNNKSRIGSKPYSFYMSEIESIDIDYENDYKLAKLIGENKGLFKEFS